MGGYVWNLKYSDKALNELIDQGEKGFIRVDDINDIPTDIRIGAIDLIQPIGYDE